MSAADVVASPTEGECCVFLLVQTRMRFEALPINTGVVEVPVVERCCQQWGRAPRSPTVRMGAFALKAWERPGSIVSNLFHG